MVDLFGKDKGNISLSMNLQSWDDEKEKSKPTIINTQRAFYNIKIEDIGNRINRLKDRNNELLEEIEITDERSVTIDAETADEIANLNKQFHSQNDKAEGLKIKIDYIENDRIEDNQIHDNKEKLFKQKYKTRKIELVSRIKVLTAKINGLEGFKKTQSILEEKMEINRKQMIKNEEKMKELLEIVNRKFEFDKEMLKNEMYTCLLDLAAQFQVETDKHMSLPNKRLMRENILLKNELSQISKQISLKNDVQSIFKNSIVDHKKGIVVKSSDVRQNIVIGKIQNAVLKCLRNKFENTKEHFSSINVPDPAMESRYLMLIEKARRKDQETDIRLSKLNNLLQKERTRKGIAKYLYRKLNCKIRAAIETIYDLKYIVKCLFECPDKYPDIANLNCTEKLLFLRNIFMQGQSKISCGVIKSVETIPQASELYAKNLENIFDYKDFEIITESEEKEEISDEIKLTTDLDEQKEISIGSTDLLSEEQSSKDISGDTISFDLKDDKSSENYEYVEDESIFSIEE